MTTKDIQPQISLLSSLTGPAWKNIDVKPHHGINLPLFSLHTKMSSGIGEYLDLKPAIDWVKKIGYDIIQILPINDTGPQPSPYSALSAFALNPLHISLSALPNVENYDDLLFMISDMQGMTKQQRIDYPTLQKKKKMNFYISIFNMCLLLNHKMKPI